MKPAFFRTLLCCLVTSLAGHAADLTWDANAAADGQTDGTGTWLTASQWWDGAANVNWADGNNALIGNSGAGGTLTLGNVSAGTLGFSAFSGTYTLTGGNLTLGNGLTVNAGAGAVALTSPVTLSANQSWQILSPNPLTATGIISGGFGLTKTGSGTLVLNAPNTFTGDVFLNAGTLRTGGNSAGTLGSGSSLLKLNGGTLDFQNSGTTNFARNTLITGDTTLIPNRATVSQGLTYAFGSLSVGNQNVVVQAGSNVNSGTAAVTFGATTLTGTPTFNVINPDLGGAAQLILGAVSGAGQGLVKEGNGLLILNGATSYTGNTVINHGLLRFSNVAFAGPNRSIYVADDATVAAGTPIDNSFLKRLAETSNAFVVALATGSGSALDFSTNNGASLPNASLGAIGSVSYSGVLTPSGYIYRLGGGGGILKVQSVLSGAGKFVLINGPGTVWLDQNLNNTYDDGTYVSSGGALEYSRAGNNQDIGGSGRTITVSDNASLVCGGTIDNGFLSRILENSNSMSVFLTLVSANPLDFSSSNGANLPNAILGGGTSGASLTYTGTITPNGATYRLGGGAYTASAGLEFLLPGAALVGSNSLIVRSLFNSTSTNAHRVVLSGTNTYNGKTTIDRQLLRLDTATGSIANSTSIELTNGGQLSLNNANGTNNHLNRLNNAASVTVTGGGALSFTVASDLTDYSETVGPLIVNSGLFQYTSTLSPSAAKLNQFTFGGLSTPGTGTITFNATTNLGQATTGNPTVYITGQADLGGSNGDWLGPQCVASRGSISFAGYGPAGVVAISGSSTATSVLQTLSATSTDATKIYRLNGSTSLSLSAGPTTRTWKAFTYQGGGTAQSLDLNGNSIKLVGGGIALSNAALTILNGTLTTGNTQSVPLYIHTNNNGGTSTISAVIADNPSGGALTLIKSNLTTTGTLTLTGANTYTGDTIVNAGNLILTNPYLANGADVRLFNGSVLQLDYTSTDTIRRLYLDGVQQPAGLWGAPSSGAPNTSPMLLGKGILNVTENPVNVVPNGYALWIASFGLTGANAAPSFDYDRDGLPNAIEYILATSPTQPNPGGPVAAKSGSNFTFTFQRAIALKSPDTTTTIEVGTSLNTWPSIFVVGNDTASSTPGVTITPGPSPASENVQLSVPLANGPRTFARLRVTISAL